MTGGSTNGRREAAVSEARAFAVGAPMIIALVGALFGVSYLLAALLGLPPSFDLPPVARALGGAILVAGAAVAVWTFRARRPADVIVSTYVTLTKALSRTPPAAKAGRKEPLVAAGPQRYTRNPLYLGVVLIVSGSALFAASPFLAVAALVFLGWFVLVLIPYEESELRALFGEEWARYSEETPMLVPFTKRRKRGAR
ncbi:MAG TPA: isoprenylcysteine carboxylmethyltransferase family protein [Nitrososphaerales archaeon]|nr:isoprenylcysteine carboxylmethyltransferase family protein [Nitrososphaerales archaeon]